MSSIPFVSPSIVISPSCGPRPQAKGDAKPPAVSRSRSSSSVAIPEAVHEQQAVAFAKPLEAAGPAPEAPAAQGKKALWRKAQVYVQKGLGLGPKELA